MPNFLVDKSINRKENGCGKLAKKLREYFETENKGLYSKEDYDGAVRKYVCGVVKGKIPNPF